MPTHTQLSAWIEFGVKVGGGKLDECSDFTAFYLYVFQKISTGREEIVLPSKNNVDKNTSNVSPE
jgi:hypothetical protein